MHDGDFIVLQFEDLCTKRGVVGSLLLWNLHKSYTVVKYDKNDYFSHNFGNIHINRACQPLLTVQTV